MEAELHLRRFWIGSLAGCLTCLLCGPLAAASLRTQNFLQTREHLFEIVFLPLCVVKRFVLVLQLSFQRSDLHIQIIIILNQSRDDVKRIILL